MKRLFGVFLVLVLITGVVFANGGKEAEGKQAPVTVYTFAAAQGSEYATAVDMAFKRLEESNPGVKYSLSGVPYAEYWDQLTLDISAGVEKDVIMIDAPTNVMPYQKLRPDGAFVDLTDIVAKSDVLSKLAGLQMGNFEGKLLSVPAVVTSWAGIWYRKSHFEAAGIDPASIKTWDDLLKAATALTIDRNNDGKPDQFGLGFGTKNEPMIRWWSQQFFWTLGGGWFKDDTNGPYTAATVNFNSPENIYTLTYLKALRDASIPPGTRSHDDIRAMYGADAVSMMIDGSYGSGAISASSEEAYADTDVFKFPGAEFKGKYYKPVSPFWGLSWAISAKTKNLDGAVRFLEEYYAEPIQEWISAYQAPAAPSALDAFAKENARAAKFIEWGASDDFKPVGFPINDNFNQLDKIHASALANVLQGVMTPEEAAKWGQSEMVRIMGN